MTSSQPVPTPVDLLDRHSLRERVEIELAAFLDRKLSELGAIDPELMPVGEAICDLVLGGGKRLRPAFAYWGWRGALDVVSYDTSAAADQAERSEDTIVRAAASLELVQAGALIHDDVMDRARTRRGQPALHVRFTGLHTANRWRGSAAGFGQGVAILAGDIALTWAQEMLRTAGLDDAALARAAPAYDAMRIEVMAGQYLDLLGQVHSGRPDEQALAAAWRTARYKSASYTVQRPLHIGALAAGHHAGEGPLLMTYSEYGFALGEAFQLRDDVLGVFGDPQQTGKPAGDDLREGKQTLLVILARQRASANARDLFERKIGRGDLSGPDIDQLRMVIEGSGALAQIEVLIAQRVETAREALANGPVGGETREVLEQLATTLTARDR
ncbi:MAG: polyprenyl synthetase family protein [Actinomycetota bacterium]|nr:polyprenyl synthetase family protein [Actinomycetota bacterium]